MWDDCHEGEATAVNRVGAKKCVRLAPECVRYNCDDDHAVEGGAGTVLQNSSTSFASPDSSGEMLFFGSSLAPSLTNSGSFCFAQATVCKIQSPGVKPPSHPGG